MLLTEVVAVFRAEVASAFSLVVTGDHSTEARVGGLDGTIDKGKLSDVVLVDHAQDRLLLAHVRLRLLNFLLVRRFKLPKAIVANEMVRLLLGFAVEAAEGRRNTARSQTVDVGLSITSEFLLRVLLVGLLTSKT